MCIRFKIDAKHIMLPQALKLKSCKHLYSGFRTPIEAHTQQVLDAEVCEGVR